MRHYDWVDPLRGFAAVSVLLYHLAELAALPLPSSYPGAWFRIGFLGVDLFFAISGAVIVLSLANLQRRHPGAWRSRYAVRRLARIVPLYLLTSIVFVVLVRPELLDRPDRGWLLAAQALFVQNLSASTHGAINGPSWTLAVEMQFYLLAGVLGVRLLRAPLPVLAVLAIALAAGWRWWGLARFGAMEAAAPGTLFRWGTQLPGVIDTFAAGIIAARWQLQQPAELPRRGARALALLAAALAGWIVGIALMHAAAAAGGYWLHPLGQVGSHLVISLAAGLTVAAALAAPPLRRPVPLLRIAGDLSYGIYLWHLPVLLLVAGGSLQPWSNAVAVVVATIGIAWLGWHLVERPLIARARRFGRVDPARPVAA